MAHGERGQALSLFVVVVMLALLLVTGLVVDGGRKSAEDRRVELAAAAAARAAVDATAPSRQAGQRPDRAAALAAARQRLASEDGVTSTVSVAADGTVRVTTSATVDTVFLSLIGIRTLSVDGEAQAQLHA
jgi:Flp pilus assembly protein TadG